jgi:hypothetical protein
LAFGITSRTWSECSTENVTNVERVRNIESVKNVEKQGNIENVKVVLVKEEGGLHSWPPERLQPEKLIWNFFKQLISMK